MTRGLALAAVLLGAGTAFAQGTAALTGNVTDASTRQPIADAVVTATSPQMQGEQIVVTDATGLYRIPQLPGGVYTIRVEKEGYKPYARGDIGIRVDTTIRVNVEMLPESIQAEDIVVVGRPPTIDIGSSTTGANIGQEYVKKLALLGPTSRGGAARSYESLALVAPQTQSDQFGISISGTTSPENGFIVDGVSTGDPAFGINGTPLSVEFIQEVNVVTGGYMPEYGRAMGGVMNVVTQSGSNEFHGSVWGFATPGALEGNRTPIQRNGQVIDTQQRLGLLADAGATLGGPIIKDKLWFFAGISPSMTRYDLTRRLMTQRLNGGVVVRDSKGFIQVDPIAGTERQYEASRQSFQYMGKLTYNINQDHRLVFSVNGTPTTSGSETSLPIDPQDDIYATNLIAPGDRVYESLGGRFNTASRGLSLNLSDAFMDKRVLLDTTIGWHHQDYATLPADGSLPGSMTGMAANPFYTFTRRRQITFYEDDPALLAAGCDPATVAAGVNSLCPVTTMAVGGVNGGFISVDDMDRWQGKIIGTYFTNLLGHHEFKAGFDTEYIRYHRNKAYTGGYVMSEVSSLPYWVSNRQFGYITGPDQATIVPNWESTSQSYVVGGFIQDRWSVLDLFTLNLGVRYDAQTLIGGDNLVGLSLPNQWSPRLGFIWDFTRQGRSKIYANYARYYELVPLDIADRQFPGERQVNSWYNSATSGCNPNLANNFHDANCHSDANLAVDPFVSGNDPNQYWSVTGGDKSPVDPDIKPTSTDEIVAGAEYEIIPDARLGASFTMRYMNHVIEDMSRDEATTYFIGNPGFGIASDFPEATRDYRAFTLYMTKVPANNWLLQASYTYSILRGNFVGLFRPETGQLDPNINSTFDLISLLENGTGPLPGDNTHFFKLFAAKELPITGSMSVNLGAGYSVRSGRPLNALGRHAIYGADEVFVLPRGGVGRLPPVHNIDTNLGFNMRFSRDSVLTLTVDVFNLFNFQQITQRQQRYTQDFMDPQPGATPNDLRDENGDGLADAMNNQTGTPVTIFPSFMNPTSYQAPRTFRFGARLTF